MKKIIILFSLVICAAAIVVVTLIIRVRSLPSQTIPIKVGALFALSGFASEWGEGELRAVQLAVTEVNAYNGINGQSIELIIEDIQSDDAVATNAINKLIFSDRVPVILGPTWGETFAGTLPVAEQNHTVLISPSAAIEVAEQDQDFNYFFSTFWPLEEEVLTLQRYSFKNNLTHITIINDTGAFNTAIVDLFKKHYHTFGLTIDGQLTLPVDSTDFKSVLIKARENDSDIIFVEIEDISQLGLFMKQVKELDINSLIISTTSAQNENLLHSYSEAMEGIIYSYPHLTADQSLDHFAQQYLDRYHTPPGPSSVNAYNAMQMVIAALKKGARSGPEIKDSLNTLSIDGIGTDQVSFNEQGQIEGVTFDIKTIRDGEFVEME